MMTLFCARQLCTRPALGMRVAFIYFFLFIQPEVQDMRDHYLFPIYKADESEEEDEEEDDEDFDEDWEDEEED